MSRRQNCLSRGCSRAVSFKKPGITKQQNMRMRVLTIVAEIILMNNSS